MNRIAQSLTDLIGNTPLLELNNLSSYYKLNSKIIAKLEYLNPGRSVKDRIGYAMIKDAEDAGIIDKTSVIIEPTSGNTGIGLALVCAAKGYRLILTMPESMSIERRSLLKAMGAELVLTPGFEGMAGALKKAEELASQIPGSFIPQQFKNPSNPTIHRKTTAEEIWRDTDGNIDIFIAGMGTGGTITGVGEFLKSKNKNIQIIGIEPFDSPLISCGTVGPHKIQGIGPNFIPETLNKSILDEIIGVKNQDAFKTVKELMSIEGLLVGISSGAAAWAALEIAKKAENKGKSIVVLLPDTGERYLSIPSLFD